MAVTIIADFFIVVTSRFEFIPRPVVKVYSGFLWVSGIQGDEPGPKTFGVTPVGPKFIAMSFLTLILSTVVQLSLFSVYIS